MHSTRQKHEMKISNMLYFSDISIFVWQTKHNSVDFGYGVLKKHVLFQLEEKQAQHIISAH